MSNRQKKYYGKDHFHQPARGVGAYSREALRELTEEDLNQIIEEGLDEIARVSRPYGELDTND